MKKSYKLGKENINLNKLNDKISIINAALNYKDGNGELIVSFTGSNANSLEQTETLFRIC